ncbi:MAG: hypothetical protein AB7H96_00930 [Vicinamibacterales bacterium]
MSPIAQPFTLELSSQGTPVTLIEALAGQVFQHVGCTTAPTAELAAALEKAAGSGTFGGAGRCDIQLRAHGQTLDIVVSANGGRIWQTRCSLP